MQMTTTWIKANKHFNEPSNYPHGGGTSPFQGFIHEKCIFWSKIYKVSSILHSKNDSLCKQNHNSRSQMCMPQIITSYRELYPNLINWSSLHNYIDKFQKMCVIQKRNCKKHNYNKTCLKRPLKVVQNFGFLRQVAF